MPTVFSLQVLRSALQPEMELRSHITPALSCIASRGVGAGALRIRRETGARKERGHVSSGRQGHCFSYNIHVPHLAPLTRFHSLPPAPSPHCPLCTISSISYHRLHSIHNYACRESRQPPSPFPAKFRIVTATFTRWRTGRMVCSAMSAVATGQLAYAVEPPSPSWRD